MKKLIQYSFCFLILVSAISCKKTEGFNSLSDNKPEVPVTVANAYEYLPAPTIKASKAEKHNKINMKTLIAGLLFTIAGLSGSAQAQTKTGKRIKCG